MRMLGKYSGPEIAAAVGVPYKQFRNWAGKRHLSILRKRPMKTSLFVRACIPAGCAVPALIALATFTLGRAVKGVALPNFRQCCAALCAPLFWRLI